jgi:hypothetical protein
VTSLAARLASMRAENPSARLLLLVLEDLVGPGGSIEATMDELAEAASMSRRTVRRAVSELAQAGELLVDRMAGLTGRYTLASTPATTPAILAPPVATTPAIVAPATPPLPPDPPTPPQPPTAVALQLDAGGFGITLEPTPLPAVVAAPPTPRPAAPAPARKARPRDELFDALVEHVLGGEPPTRREATKVGMAAADLRELGATPADVAVRAEHYRAHFDGAPLTPLGLVGQWARCANPPPPPRADNGNHRAARDARTRAELQAWAANATTPSGGDTA